MPRVEVQDLIDLSLLLLVRDQHVSARTAIPAVQTWGAPAFQPTGDVVAGRLAELRRLGLVHCDGNEAAGLLSLTEEGRVHAAHLLARQPRGTCAPVHLSSALRLALSQALANPEAQPHGNPVG